MADVWSVEHGELSKIRPLLDKHAAATNDRPVTTIWFTGGSPERSMLREVEVNLHGASLIYV